MLYNVEIGNTLTDLQQLHARARARKTLMVEHYQEAMRESVGCTLFPSAPSALDFSSQVSISSENITFYNPANIDAHTFGAFGTQPSEQAGLRARCPFEEHIDALIGSQRRIQQLLLSSIDIRPKTNCGVALIQTCD